MVAMSPQVLGEIGTPLGRRRKKESRIAAHQCGGNISLPALGYLYIPLRLNLQIRLVTLSSRYKPRWLSRCDNLPIKK